MPRHIAVIMDGNGRWAKRRGLPPNCGPSSRGRYLEKSCCAVAATGRVEALTAYAFSTENWGRPIEEV